MAFVVCEIVAPPGHVTPEVVQAGYTPAPGAHDGAPVQRRSAYMLLPPQHTRW
jgi:hypothetical protein